MESLPIVEHFVKFWGEMPLLRRWYMAASVAMFIPAMAHADFGMRNGTVEAHIKSPEVFIFAACALSACINPIIDVLLDMIFCRTAGFLGIRLIGLLSLVLYCSLFLGLTGYDNFGMILLIFSNWLIFSISFMILKLLHLLDTTRCWTFRRVFLILLTLFAYFNLDYVYLVFPSISAFSILRDISGFLFFAGFVVVGCLWYRSMYKLYQISGIRVFSEWAVSLGPNDYACFAVLLVALITIPVWIALPMLTGDTPALLYSQILLRSFLTIFTISVPGRIFKQAAIEETANTKFKTEWVSFISHELRTPLNIISMGLQLTHNNIRQGKEVEVLSTIQDLEVPCSQALELLNDILFLEMSENGRLELLKTDMNPYSFIKRGMKSTAVQAQELGILLNCHSTCYEELRSVVVNLDEDRFEYIFHKILSKSVNDGVQLKKDVITVQLEIVEDSSVAFPRASINVDSKQIRIAPTNLMSSSLRVKFPILKELTDLDRFMLQSETLHFTRKPHDDHDSYGLGMFIMQKIARLHGGKIHEMSGFLCLDLPLASSGDVKLVNDVEMSRIFSSRNWILSHVSIASVRESIDATTDVVTQSNDRLDVGLGLRMSRQRGSMDSLSILGPVQEDRNSTSTENSHKAYAPMKLLVVDDSTLTRKIIVKTMVGLGHTCSEASDGAAAATLMKSALTDTAQFDAVLLDNEMPVMKGRDCAIQMRADGYGGIIVGVTGNVLKADVDDFLQCGADCVLLKPMTVEKFHAAIEECRIKKRL